MASDDPASTSPSSGGPPIPGKAGPPADRDAEEESDHDARGLRIASWCLKARRLREEMFGPQLFADPAWDILLDLYTAGARQQRVQITSLAVAARVPHSTAIRWARIMTRAGLLVREKDPSDGRRIYVTLSPHTRARMKHYLDRLSWDISTLPQAQLDIPR